LWVPQAPDPVVNGAHFNTSIPPPLSAAVLLLAAGCCDIAPAGRAF